MVRQNLFSCCIALGQVVVQSESVIPAGRKSNSCHQSTSDVFLTIAGVADESMSLRDLSNYMGDRGFGLLLLLFALPNCIPFPLPGISTLTGLPLIFIAAQLFLGRDQLWLPAKLADHKIPMVKLRPLVLKTYPWLVRLEKFVRPRFDILTTRSFERVAGGLLLLLTVLLALPIPLSNFPLGIAIAALALAITERDGIMMLTGWIFSVVAFCIFAMLVSGYVWMIWQLLIQIS